MHSIRLNDIDDIAIQKQHTIICNFTKINMIIVATTHFVNSPAVCVSIVLGTCPSESKYAMNM